MSKNNFNLSEKMIDLIETLEPDESTKTIVFSDESRELINEISGHAEKTKLYQENKDRSDTFNDCTAEQLWYILLQKIVNAPTSLHRDGSVILLMPILNRKLRKD